jgi:hypothetical protein
MWLEWNWRRRAPTGYVFLSEAVDEIRTAWRVSRRNEASLNAFEVASARRPKRKAQSADQAGQKVDDKSADRPSATLSMLEDVVRPEISIWDVLRELLFAGAIPSYRTSRTGHLSQLPPNYWGEIAELELRETRRLKDGVVEYGILGRIVIPTAQLNELLKLVSSSKEDSHMPHPERGGAPPKYDSEAFLIEAFRIVYESKPTPSTAAELRKRALDAYAEAGHMGGAPGEDWARRKIKRLWQQLGLGARGENS